jgi:hypothetical protein
MKNIMAEEDQTILQKVWKLIMLDCIDIILSLFFLVIGIILTIKS